MAKRTQTMRKPMLIHIDQGRIPLEIRSHEFRRLLRLVAINCASQHEDQRGMTDRKMRDLTRAYRQGLFLLLTTPASIPSKSWPAESDEFEFDFEIDTKDAAVWEKVKEQWSTSRRTTNSRKARLNRIATVSTMCEIEKLHAAIEGLGEIYRMQNNCGIPVDAITDADLNQPTFGQVIREACPWERTDPELQVGTNGSFFGMDSIHPADLNNCLAIGGTGSGKSTSLVMPLLEAQLRYRLNDGTVGSLLVIDPKKELLGLIRSVLHQRQEDHRLVVIGECPPVSMFASDLGFCVADKLQKIQAFGPQDTSHGDHGYWRNLGMAVLQDLLQLESAFAMQTRGQRLFARLCADFRLNGTAKQGFWQQLRAVLSHSRTSRARLKEFDVLLRFYCRLTRIESRSIQVAQVYCGDEDMHRQWGYAVQSIDPSLVAWSGADGVLLDMDIVRTPVARFTDIGELVDTGKVVVFCPENTLSHQTVAKALKMKFYEAIYSRSNQRRPVAVIVDEAHQFITGDKESSEAMMIDRVRAYRTNVVLCSQSVSSMKYALASTTGEAQAATDILLINCPSRWIFRTTDVDTTNWLKAQIPCSSEQGEPHVIDIRRPAGLRPGEAYYMLADGSWGRKRAIISAVTANRTQDHKVEELQ